MRLPDVIAVFLSLALLAGPSPFKVRALRPVEELRNEARKAAPPAEPGNFRPPDLVDLRDFGAGLHFDIRYATTNNFLGTAVYPEARAFLERPAAVALTMAAEDLKAKGFGILIHDAYRPWYITKVFWEATPARLHTFVADPAKGSKHNRGCAVDLSLYDLTSGKPVQMPSGYDEMTERAHPDYRGGSEAARVKRDLLRAVMESHGFDVDRGEWWHFDFREWPHYPIINIAFADLASQADSKTLR